jgi:hypothetical protein
MMASRNHTTTRHDDPEDRCQRLRGKILDGIEDTLDDLAQPEAQRAAITDAMWAHVAPLLCQQAKCRRAKRCRSDPCIVRQAAAAANEHGA